MIKRFLTIESIPELRTDPIALDKNIPDLELTIPADVLAEVQEIVKNIRYAKLTGSSTKKLYRRFAKLIFPCIEQEKDRIWFKNRMKNI